MLFSAGVGIGMTFYGAAEPLAYYTGWYGTPFNVPANSVAAENLALGATLFNWGIGPWSIYALVGLGIGYFALNSGLPMVPRSVLYPVFGHRTWGWPGHIVDMLAILATVFGLATSLGLGARQAASGLSFLFGIESGLPTQIAFIILIAIVTVVSVVRAGSRHSIAVEFHYDAGRCVAWLCFAYWPDSQDFHQLRRSSGAIFQRLFAVEQFHWPRGYYLFSWLDDFLLGVVD